jgi:hypothetical protein
MEAQGIAWLFGEDMDIGRLLHFTTLLLCMVPEIFSRTKSSNGKSTDVVDI